MQAGTTSSSPGRLGGAGREAFRDFHIAPHGMDTALTGDLNRSGLFER